MDNKILNEFLSKKKIPFGRDVDLKKHTWIHRGGVASYYITPRNCEEFESLVLFFQSNAIEYKVFGSTSNVYVLNKTNLPVVVSILHCREIVFTQSYIEVECGVLVSRLAKQAIEKGIKGFEYLTCLPGTIAGAIVNNSSCKSNSISAVLDSVEIIMNGVVQTLTPADLHFEFRNSDLKSGIMRGTISRARLKIEYEDAGELKRLAVENEEHRHRILEPPAKNLGCTVNRLFCEGKMPSKYKIPYDLCCRIIHLFVKDELEKKRLKKNMLLIISGNKKLIPYVSDKQLITFIWRDEKADVLFPAYLSFIKHVCRSTHIEIEII